MKVENVLSKIQRASLVGRRGILAGAVAAPLLLAQKDKTRKAAAIPQQPRTIALRPDDITIVPAFHAELKGGLMAPPQPRPSLNGDFGVRGFVKPSDVLTWRVHAPEADDYQIAILYNGDNDEVLPGCTLEVICGEQKLREPVQRRWWAPERPFVARHWLNKPFQLKAGENRIAVSLASVSAAQAAQEIEPGDKGKGANNTDFRIWSMELVRPKALAAIRQRASDMHVKHGWMVEGKYGLFTHYSTWSYPFQGNQVAAKNWEWGIDLFDVGAYADAVEQTGAKWVVFTLAHGGVYWPAPSRTLDRLLPGRTTKRDLLMELADALERRGIRLTLYFNWSPNDLSWREASGMNDESNQRVGDSFAALFEETSRRYGRKIGGFPYIDSCFSAIYQHDPPWERWTRAMKAGNEHALVGYSPNRGPNVTYFNDLQLGDFGQQLPEPSPKEMFAIGGPYESAEPGWFLKMDDWVSREPFNGRFPQGPRHTEQEYVEYFKKMAVARVPVTMNLVITQDVTRKQPFFDPRCLNIMKAVRKAVRG